jgi:hypothetical protein
MGPLPRWPVQIWLGLAHDCVSRGVIIKANSFLFYETILFLK